MSESRFQLFIEGTCGGDCYFDDCRPDGWNYPCKCNCEHEFREAKDICEQLDAYETFYDKLFHSLSPEEYEQLPSEEDDKDCEILEKRLLELENFICRRSHDVDDDIHVSYQSDDCTGVGGRWPFYILGY